MPGRLRLLPPDSLSCHGHVGYFNRTAGQCQVKLSRVSTSLVTKHPVCQWCCATRAGTALGTQRAEKSLKQGQPGRAARSTSLPAPARAPNIRSLHWLQHQHYPEVTSGTIQEATSSWHQQEKQVWICRNLFPSLRFNSDHAFLVGEAVKLLSSSGSYI